MTAHMMRAILLARWARGSTSPNPPVGAVLVRDQRVVGQGRTQPAGQAHAEIMALKAAGESARGATLYVTLEPCSHWGRTPPCADAIIEAGVEEVQIALVDPNPLVQGEGVRRLLAAGIRVAMGDGSLEAAEIAAPHRTFVREGRAYTTLLPVDDPDSLQRFQSQSDVILRASPVDLPKLHPELTFIDIDASGTGVYDLGWRASFRARYELPAPVQPSRTGNDAEVSGFDAVLQALASAGVIDALIVADTPLHDALEAQRLVDRIVVPAGGDAPPGYAFLDDVPSPHASRLAYRLLGP